MKRKNIKLERKYLIFAGVLIFAICLLLLIFSKPDNIPNLAMEEISEITANVHDNFKKKPDYWGLSTAYAIENELAPQKMLKEEELISVTGGKVLIGIGEEGNIAMPGTQSFDIVYTNLSRRNCVILASYNLDYTSKLGLLSIRIKNHSKDITFSWGGENDLPIDIAQAKDNCLSSDNTIIWSFK